MKSLRIPGALILGFILGAIGHPFSSNAQTIKNSVQSGVFIEKVATDGRCESCRGQLVAFSCTEGKSGEAECYAVMTK